ncbi:MAG TPA: class II fumarate hydratase [Candidatus Acidoferrum sp.]|nr:class II fumarate hydratase [Candidatus Acidoferrum sp.]
MSGDTGTRVERDSMGEVRVPEDAFYGASTERARQNFPISGLRLPRRFIRALAQIKGAAALVNAELGLLETRLANPIQQAAEEVEEGKFDKDFVVDVFQTGSGTSTNTNANEVIANRANQILGQPLGSRKPVHPNDHVNKSQSSNDVIPTALQLAALVAIHEELVPALAYLKDALDAKAKEFMPVIKTGRTHLQDATPIRLGQEFAGYTGQVLRALDRVQRAAEELADLPLGGTAVGTGINAHPEFAQRVASHLSRRAGVPVHETDNHFQAQATLDAVLSTAGALRTTAVGLWKIGNDLRWFASGPRAGLGEITLPEVQPGSSIMPGKVNPVIIESVTMVVAKVLGNDQTIAIAAQSGSIFELNLMMPVAAYSLLESIALLAAAAQNFAQQCVVGIKATGRGPDMVEQGLMLATALVPAIGYDAAAKIAKEALTSGKTIREIARERTKLAPDELERLLDPARMTQPGVEAGPAGG